MLIRKTCAEIAFFSKSEEQFKNSQKSQNNRKLSHQLGILLLLCLKIRNRKKIGQKNFPHLAILPFSFINSLHHKMKPSRKKLTPRETLVVSHSGISGADHLLSSLSDILTSSTEISEGSELLSTCPPVHES